MGFESKPWIGICTNNADPEFRGRIQVRVFGVHDMYDNTIPSAPTESNNSFGLIGENSVLPQLPEEIKIPEQRQNHYEEENTNNNQQNENTNQSSASYYIEKYIAQLRRAIGSHYSQPKRNSDGYYDCSSLVSRCLRLASSRFNIPLSKEGNNPTTSDLPSILTSNGFKRYAYGSIKLERGDILRRPPTRTRQGHVGTYIGGGRTIEALNSKYPIQEFSVNFDSKNPWTEIYRLADGAKPEFESQPINSNSNQTTTTGNQTGGNYSGSNSYSSDSTEKGIPVEKLPWAMCSYPVTFGGTPMSTCPPPQVQVGAWVHGISLDGDFFNELLVLGVLSNKETMSPFALNENGSSTGSNGIGSSADRNANANIDGSDLQDEPQVTNLPENSADGIGTSSINMATFMKCVRMAETGDDYNHVDREEWGAYAMTVPECAYIIRASKNINLINPEYVDTINALADWTQNREYPYSGWENIEGAETFAQKLLEKPIADTIAKVELVSFLRECNNDPFFALLIHNQGIENARHICNYIGVNDWKTGNMSYVEFAKKATDAAENLGLPHPDILTYSENAFQGIGGLSKLDELKDKNCKTIVTE